MSNLIPFQFESREALQAICESVVARLAEEGLTVHPHKLRLAPVSAGVPYLGYIVWPQHISAGQYLRRRYHHRLRQHETAGQDRTQALQSYRAALLHTGATA